MKKLLSITLAVTTIAWLAGSFLYIPAAHAAVVDGDIVSPDATFVDADGNTYYSYDVFIVKIVGTKTFKRLVLNPQVFESYGHLKWSNIQTISADTVKGYTTSALVRAINDSPVYVLAPNGDGGTKQWVDDLTCFNSKGYDWDSVYTINATDRDNYSTTTSLCGTGGGALTLSLASDTPAASTLPNNVQGVSFVKYNLTGSGTLNQITFKRDGAGDVGDFGDIYVYKNGVRLTSGRALSTSNSKVTFINLGIVAPTTFELVADISTGTAGDINYFTVETSSDVVADGTVSGAFPIKGNPMGISGTAAGTLTVARAGSAARNVTIGALEQEIAQFKVTVATEGANVYRVQLFNGGTADNALVTNLKLKDNTGVTVATATSIGTNGYVAFVFNTPYYITKGENEIFRVYGDVGAQKPDRTIILYQELATDILAKGTTYGYGMAATIDDFDTTGDAVTVTCKGGDLTLNKVGPNATSIGTATSDTVFLEYTIAAAADITIKRTRIFICIDAGGDGVYDTTSGSADIEDIKIREKDSGVVVIGPKDGTAINDGSVDDGTCGVNGAEYEDFTDVLDLIAGTTKTYQLTADIKTSNADSGTVVAANAKLKMVLYSYASLIGANGNVSYMKYAGTSDAVDDSAIAPSGHIAGEEMTVGAASLAVTLAASPSGADVTSNEKTYIKGQNGVDVVGFVFTAGSASDIIINSIQLTAYTTENTTVALDAGIDTNYVKDTVGSVYIYDKSTGAMVPGSSAKGFTSGDNYENVDFTGLNWTIPAGDSKTLLVKNDISSAAPASASTADTWIGFDILVVSSDVSAVDSDGNSVDGSGDASNPLAATVNYGVAAYGSLAIDGASDTPDKNLVIMDTPDNEVSKFKLTGTSEAWYIETFSIMLDDGAEALTALDNFEAIKLKYQTEAQWGTSNWTISSGRQFASTASLSFSFIGSNRIYVPKDDNSYVTVLASIEGYNGGTGAKSKIPFKIWDIDGGTSLKAYGAQSGKQLTSFTTNNSVIGDYNYQFVARSRPVFAKVSSTAANELARFTITAVGYDVVFDGTSQVSSLSETNLTSACLRFDVIASTTADATVSMYLYDWNENVLSSAEALGSLDGTVTSVSFQFEERDATIPVDTTKEFHIDLAAADVSTDFLKLDEFIYLQLRNDDNDGTEENLATGSWDNGSRDVVWHDGTNEEGLSSTTSPDAELRYGMPALIKNIGSLPITFTIIKGSATP